MSRTALVTGGTGGLGTAVTRTMLDQGWRVVVPWISEEHRARLDDHPRLEFVEADLFEESQAAVAAERAASQAAAPLRAVVNLVGGFAMGGTLHETPITEFDQQMRLNVRPTYLVSQAALPHLLDAGGGAIVCVSSKAALKPFRGGAGYVTSKAAVLALVDTLAVEYGKRGVRANAVLPGMIDTPGNRAAQPDADRSGWTPPEEIARVISFLCEESSGAVNGARIPV
ncbi:SDR family NAD(P)-dependent oxidoreductase [Haloechinothrix sp. LS1_15]|uniref:SDR family NAD(P)-dependent oxidoreductase n=1 Tax=Haloechinothrix sp. LS1_15 TaxID=2652248 RepID=UPI0029475B79|nr:SDR family NAD(P)-dependent oxidoreductase [Haloechinothrix sp. LS1_15]MDV6012869.1 SDR family NAD(P)-dependent oxidoreductase [Haloechinothrix sp. LS1_15]